MGEHVLGPCHVPLCSFVQACWLWMSGFAASLTLCLFPNEHGQFGDRGCQGRDLLEEVALLPLRTALQGLQLGLRCQQEGLAIQPQVGSHDLASTPQSVRTLLSPWQRVWA